MSRATRSKAALVQVHVGVVDQLFNSIDPSPFHIRDLDLEAEAYILDCAHALPKKAPLELVIHLDQPPGTEWRHAVLEHAIQTHFATRAAATRIDLQQLFQRGRISLVIGLTCLAAAFAVWESGKHLLPDGGGMAQMLREGLMIGGWVAMWRPMEIFLYDWWPVAADIRLFDRLSKMSVQVVYRPPHKAKAHEP